MVELSGSYPPPSAPANDDRCALALLAALVELARKDADRGDVKAAAWLADLAAQRPRGAVRILGAEILPPVEAAQVEPVPVEDAPPSPPAAPPPVPPRLTPAAPRPPVPAPQCSALPGTILARALPLAEARGWPGRLNSGAAGEIAEALGVHPGSVRNALAGLRRAVGTSTGAADD